MKGFWVLQLSIANRQERESEQIMNLLSSEEATNYEKHGNTVVDQEAQDALDKPISNCSIPHTDFKPFIVKYILKRWQDSWDQQIHNKLHEIHPLIGRNKYSWPGVA
jgi:hypothetical protein